MIAVAAGIAEGTIFRVFPDKDSLVQAAVDKAFDPSPMEAALAAIDPDEPFEQRLQIAVSIVQARLADIWRLVSAVGADKVPGSARRRPQDEPGLIALFEPERENLRQDPVVSARMLRALTLAGSHPALIPDDPMSPADIVSLLLDGIRRRPETGAPSRPSKTSQNPRSPETKTRKR